MQGLIGRKIGMTRIFDNATGVATPVTIVKIGENIVQQLKTVENDGYAAVQIGFDVVSEKKANKAELGHFKKHNSAPTRVTKEFDLDRADEVLEPGQKLTVEYFETVLYVDVVGWMKGRGFAGTIKKYNFRRGRETHGNSNLRERGSLGAGTYPARVFPGLKMAGHWGNERVTIKGIKVVGIDKENGLMFLKGGIPGKNTGVVYVKRSVSKK